MIASALQAAIGTTVVQYDKDLAPGRPVMTVIAEAMNAAVVGATNEAIKQLARAHPARELRVHGTTVAQHVGPGAVTATCVLIYEVRPVLLEGDR